MYKDLLPIGSIVRLVDGEKRVMVTGRIAASDDMISIYDYVGCLYPEGVTGTDEFLFFNRDNIADIFFIGFQDIEEMEFRHGILDNLGELEIVDGKIVSK